MGLTQLTGEVLDEKYRIERELGKGGMGSVYLATHLGTGRPVAVKVITPQFMMNDEFVERFKREAKAAGRLHHPNVVNVTDFGFAHVEGERIAYLVMEYLDGCTLAEVLAEESQLPIDWVVDIIEQTSSAVAEAHQQGIIHRDLKPDNIWLEPNRRGGYTVKVLDFGLAKLGDIQAADDYAGLETSSLSEGKRPAGSSATMSDQPRTTGIIQQDTYAQTTELSEAATQVQSPAREDDSTLIVEPVHSNNNGAEEAVTQILPVRAAQAATQVQPVRESENQQTLMFEQTTADNQARHTVPAEGLTRVGSILGTPIYMSPEQCRSEPLDARSDIYSLGVIAYQMLAGEPPFKGPAFELMKLHIEAPPPPLREKRRKVPKRMAAAVMSSLAKSPADRPASADGFASAIRATADGTGALLRRSFALYVEHFPKFFRVTFLMYLPLILLHIALLISGTMSATSGRDESTGGVKFEVGASASGPLEVILSIVMFFANFFINAVIVGATIRLVTQLFLSPLRPLQVRTAYAAVKKRLKALLVTLVISSIRLILGLILLVIPAVIMFINYSLAAPVVMMEGLKGRAALKRSKALVKRCRWSVIVILLCQWAIPFIATSIVALPVAFALKMSKTPNAPEIAGRVTSTIVVMLNVLIVPFIATLTALLYLKARQIGGETLREVLSQFEEEDTPRTKWQMRMRERLQTTSKS
ncbi:MAG TPA: serine/threonine-protein kinase [Blastocatellia bacterium]|nr:serine/threonine-protein kinase [Blastocatellia bacterium]